MTAKPPVVLRGEGHPGAKLTADTARALLAAHAAGTPKQVLQDRFGITRHYLNRVLRGDRWRSP